MSPTLALESCWHQRIPCQPCHCCSNEEQGVPSHRCAHFNPAMALRWEQHQELRLWPLPGVE